MTMYSVTKKSDGTYKAELRTQDSKESLGFPSLGGAIQWLVEGARTLNGTEITSDRIQFFEEVVDTRPVFGTCPVFSSDRHRDEEGHVFHRLLGGKHNLFAVATFGGYNMKYAVGTHSSQSFFNKFEDAYKVWEHSNHPDICDLPDAKVRAERLLKV